MSYDAIYSKRNNAMNIPKSLHKSIRLVKHDYQVVVPQKTVFDSFEKRHFILTNPVAMIWFEPAT